MKACTRCGQMKLASEFGRNRCRSDGLADNCKQCVRFLNKQYRLNHPETARRAAKAWARENPGKAANWRRQNVAKISEVNRKWREANPEYHHQWRKDNPDKERAHKCRRRDLKISSGERFTDAMIRFCHACWMDTCAVCNRVRDASVDPSFHIDHWLPLSLGYKLSLDNAVILCPSCNSHKQGRLPQDVFSSSVVHRIEKRIVHYARTWEEVIWSEPQTTIETLCELAPTIGVL